MAPWQSAAKRIRIVPRAGATGFVLLCFLLLAPVAAAQSDSVEAAVKATYLYKFAPFVDWPTGTFPSTTSPVTLCVIGDDPFGSVLDRAVAGQTVGQRPIEIRRRRTAERNSGCHIMYIAGSAVQSVAEALAVVRGTPVLTVTNSVREARVKGIIHFVLAENRVRFEIDDYAAAESRLAISSKVLALAVSVRPRS